ELNVIALVELGLVAIGYAVGPIILSRSLSELSSYGVVASSLLLNALAYLPFAILRWPSSMPSKHVIESVLGLAVVCTALAFLIFFALIAEVGPLRATVITYVNPAVAAILGVTLLSEHVTVGMVA